MKQDKGWESVKDARIKKLIKNGFNFNYKTSLQLSFPVDGSRQSHDYSDDNWTLHHPVDKRNAIKRRETKKWILSKSIQTSKLTLKAFFEIEISNGEKMKILKVAKLS